ncbi:MAG: hypothetical protein EOO07_26535, partial [Chitinophagaceae bacterium]
MLNLALGVRSPIRWCAVLFLAIHFLYGEKSFADEPPRELLTNPGLEEISPSGLALGWTFSHWMSDIKENTVTRDETVTHSGAASLKIISAQNDDSQLLQSVKVEPQTWYRLSAWVKTSGIPQDNNIGANLGVTDVMEHSVDIKGDNDWQELVVWGKTGEDQQELNVVLRLGFYGSLNTGTAWFDDVSLIKAEPSVDTFATEKIINFTSSPSYSTEENSFSIAIATPIAIGVTVIFLFVCWLSIREREFLYQHLGAITHGMTPLTKTWPILGLISCVILIKAIAAAFFVGYPYD